MRGFGASIDLETSISRKWYIDKEGVRRWHDDDSVSVRELPVDVARCNGVRVDNDWRDGCDVCFRRLSKPHELWQAYIEPPEIIVFECEFLITK